MTVVSGEYCSSEKEIRADVQNLAYISDHWIHGSDENCSQRINKRKRGDRDGASTLKEK